MEFPTRIAPPGARGSNMGNPLTLFSGRNSLVWFVVALFVMLVGPGRSRPTEAACGGSPVIATDKSDYGPTETVVISGTRFQLPRITLGSRHRSGRKHEVGRRDRSRRS